MLQIREKASKLAAVRVFYKTTLDRIINGNQPSAILGAGTQRLVKTLPSIHNLR
jgi:hypothetical protein